MYALVNNLVAPCDAIKVNKIYYAPLSPCTPLSEVATAELAYGEDALLILLPSQLNAASSSGRVGSVTFQPAPAVPSSRQ